MMKIGEGEGEGERGRERERERDSDIIVHKINTPNGIHVFFLIKQITSVSCGIKKCVRMTL